MGVEEGGVVGKGLAVGRGMGCGTRLGTGCVGKGSFKQDGHM